MIKDPNKMDLMLWPCAPYFSLLGASWGHSALLATLLVVHGRFWCVLGRSELDFGRVLGTPGMAWEVQNDDFGLFLHAHEAAPRKGSDPYKTVAGAAKIKVFYISSALHVSKKTMQNRSRGLSNRASHKDRAKNRSENSPGSVLDGSWALLACFLALLGGSWVLLGACWASPGRVLAPLGRL